MRTKVTTEYDIHPSLMRQLEDAYNVMNMNGLYNSLDDFIQDTIQMRMWEHIESNIDLILTANRHFVITDRKERR